MIGRIHALTVYPVTRSSGGVDFNHTRGTRRWRDSQPFFTIQVKCYRVLDDVAGNLVPKALA